MRRRSEPTTLATPVGSRDAAKALRGVRTAVLQHREERKCQCFRGRTVVPEAWRTKDCWWFLGASTAWARAQMAFLEQALKQTHDVSCFREPSDRSVLSKGSGRGREGPPVRRGGREGSFKRHQQQVTAGPYSGKAYQGRPFRASDSKLRTSCGLTYQSKDALKRASDRDRPLTPTSGSSAGPRTKPYARP